MNWSDFYRQVYKEQDKPPEGSSAWIQWKGTRLCADIHCECGADGHFDGDFAYVVRCTKCDRVYALAQNIKLIELTPEQRAFTTAEWHAPQDVDACEFTD